MDKEYIKKLAKDPRFIPTTYGARKKSAAQEGISVPS